MRLYLASPHTFLKFKDGEELALQVFGGANMKVFMAGNTLFPKYIAPALYGGGNVNENIPCDLWGWHRMPRTIQEDERGCKSFWQGGESRHWLHETSPIKENNIKEWKPFILESFYYTDESTEKLLPHFGDFLLDSGAFTFCGTGGYQPNKFEEYLEQYANFIKRNNIQKFFELDVDSITGYEKVLYFRKRLESLTGKQSIPVWHISRGKDEFIRHCEEYPYVALGGYVAAIKASDPRQQAYVKAYPWFIKTAHEHGAKIHGLGFTNLKGLEQYHFDSVDSTAWTTGNRFGFIYHFDGKTMKKTKVPKGKRISDPRKAALINYTEWVKFQQYAYKNL